MILNMELEGTAKEIPIFFGILFEAEEVLLVAVSERRVHEFLDEKYKQKSCR